MAKSGRRSGHGRDLCRAAERGPDRRLLTPVAAVFPLSNCLNGFGTAELTGADLSHAKLRNARFGGKPRRREFFGCRSERCCFSSREECQLGKFRRVRSFGAALFTDHVIDAADNLSTAFRSNKKSEPTLVSHSQSVLRRSNNRPALFFHDLRYQRSVVAADGYKVDPIHCRRQVKDCLNVRNTC
jgi:hypothetical protein